MKRAAAAAVAFAAGVVVALLLREKAPFAVVRPSAPPSRLSLPPGDQGARAAGPRRGPRFRPPRASGAAATTTAATIVVETGNEPRDAVASPLDRAPLRGVAGVVREAGTGRPIAGAWLVWRRPSAEDVDAVLELAGPVSRGREITDAEGRFAVDRLPTDLGPEPALYAVARGFVTLAVLPLLQESLAIELERAGALEVVGHGEGTADPDVRLERDDATPSERLTLGHLPRWPHGGGSFLVPDLRPGRYRVLSDGRPVATAVVVAGATALARVPRPRLLQTDVVVEGPDGRPLDGAALAFQGPGPSASAATDAAGRARLLLREGEHAAFLDDQGAWEELEGKVTAGVPNRVRRAEPASPVELDGPRVRGLERCVLVRAGAGRSAIRPLAPGPGGRLSGSAAAGSWLLADERGRIVARLELPRDAKTSIDTPPLVVQVRFLVPDALRAGEAIRVAIASVPADLAEGGDAAIRLADATTTFLARKDGAPHALPIELPGTWRLVGRSDLGPIDLRVEVRESGVIEVPLGR